MKLIKRHQNDDQQFKYPGKPAAVDGNTAVILCERESSDAAGAYPITPSTDMGEQWAEEVGKGHLNISDKPLIFVEPESEHAAAGITAGMAMSGLRATNFSSAQGVAFMHESLYAAAGKRLPYVLNVGSRAITKASLNVHCAHDDYHCIDDTGFIQVMANSGQQVADLNLIGRKVAELALTPAVVGQDGFLTTHLIESMRAPERKLIAEFLGRPDDVIETPTPAQRMVYGETRRRIPMVWDVDNPLSSGPVQNQEAYMQAVAAQRPYFYDHIREITDQVMEEFHALTGRRYHRVATYKADDAEYLILGMGSMTVQAEAVVDYLRETRGLKVGVVNLTMFRPFPGDLLGRILQGKKAVTVLERTDQPLAEDLPMMREVRATMTKCMENAADPADDLSYPDYAVYGPGDAPRLFSGCYGLGSRDLQPEGLIAAVENMLPEGRRRKFFYLSVDFIRERPNNPREEVHQQALLDDYPHIKDLALRGSENPNLMPDGAVTVRFHSVGGWGAMTTGKNLGLTLYELLGYEIKANPKYGSEKKGQPTTYYLSAAPERIRVNCEYYHVDLVLSPDPNVFDHSNPLSGLKRGGVFVVQSSLESPEKVWNSLPERARKQIVDNDIRLFYLDGFRIAREEASNPELQFRMQGIAFQGAFFAASPVMEQAGFDEKTLFDAIKGQLQAKFGGKGARVVEDNLRVVRRGFDELHEVTVKSVADGATAAARKAPAVPLALKGMAESRAALSDIHRFWSHTGNLYIAGKANDILADPFTGLSLMPAASGVFRDMTQIRFEYPHWLPEHCTACGDCYTVCPDSAIPGLVNTVGEVLDTAVRRIETAGKPTRHLRRANRTLEKKLRTAIEPIGDGADVRGLLDTAIDEVLAESELEGAERTSLEGELDLLRDALGHFQFAITKPYYTQREKKQAGSGGLFSITVNPYTCKGCMECVDVCDDGALVVAQQTPDAVQTLREDWAFWQDLPTTKPDFIRIDDLDEKIGALETLLLDKQSYGSMVCGDGACIGCGEKTVIHLFTGTVTALMQQRVAQQVKKLDELIEGLERHIRLKLAESVDLSNAEAVNQVMEARHDSDLTLSELSADLQGDSTLDTEWLQRTTGLLADLRELRGRYTDGTTGNGRAEMGIINATGCTSVWGSTYPYNPYPFPWTSHLFQDSPSVAMGIFEGHMARMAEGFKAVRMAELELEGGYDPAVHDDFFKRFGWKHFSDEEWLLCPPVVSVGGDGAMYDIGFQNLSRMMMSGLPVKVLVLDTQVYSNTGGQACTSGFISQVSDMAPFGDAWKGKEETRKEMSIIAMAHRTSYVLQSSMSNITHLLEGYIEGLNSRRPAVFNVYAVCQPEHGVADDASDRQSKLAVESRAYPLFKYDPDAGTTFEECTTLEGNPAMDADWPEYTLQYTDEHGKEQSMTLPLTFADFAITEARFRKHMKKVPQEKWDDSMMAVHEYLELEPDDREDHVPFVWAADAKGRLSRVQVSEELVNSTVERRNFWRQLKSLTGVERAMDLEKVASEARAEVAQKLTQSLLAMATGGGGELPAALTGGNGSGAATQAASGGNGAAADYDAVWVETPECTACDECIDIAPGIFQYNDAKQVEIVNPQGGSFKDIVKAAEKCTAECIHPGTPWNPAEADDKLLKRAAKFN